MPNYSYNTLRISGSESDMSELYETLIRNENGREIFKFSNAFPMPEKLKNTISPSSSALDIKWMDVSVSEVRSSKIDQILDDSEGLNLIPVENNSPEKCLKLKEEFGADNWYDWNIMMFGTKWDIREDSCEFSKSENQFDCSFDTAWSPPVNFIERLQKKFPNIDIELTWELEGSDECGRFYTDRDGGEVKIDHEESKLVYKSFDGEDIIFSEDEWRYEKSGEVCDDYYSVNPFNGNER